MRTQVCGRAGIAAPRPGTIVDAPRRSEGPHSSGERVRKRRTQSENAERPGRAGAEVAGARAVEREPGRYSRAAVQPEPRR